LVTAQHRRCSHSPLVLTGVRAIGRLKAPASESSASDMPERSSNARLRSWLAAGHPYRGSLNWYGASGTRLAFVRKWRTATGGHALGDRDDPIRAMATRARGACHGALLHLLLGGALVVMVANMVTGRRAV
jgi:hypothetical protein